MRKPNRAEHQVQSVWWSSFRDPAGFLFTNSDGELLRQINESGAADFDLLNSSGLYKTLTEKGWLVSHTVLDADAASRKPAYAVIKPEKVPFISYPFEWSFSQLKDAALLTLRIQKAALKHGMSLKDASAYNVQFQRGKPVFIDTLSFEPYVSGSPWQAYRQFCQHFLAPLALMAHTHPDTSQLTRIYLDGVRLDVATKMLPGRAKLRPGIAMHIVAHSKAQKIKEHDRRRPARKLSMAGLIGIIESLERTVRSLKPRRSKTEWGDYYDSTNYSKASSGQKAILVTGMLKQLKIASVLDLGGNDGTYSRPLNKEGIRTVCTDIDPNAVESNYLQVTAKKETLMLPLLIDLVNPGGALGWANAERPPIHERFQCDALMALALIHHLAISNNLPFDRIAGYFAKFAPYALVEFVPKEDSQVIKLLATRKDIFEEYDADHFEAAFSQYYSVIKSSPIPGTKRTLYLFKRLS